MSFQTRSEIIDTIGKTRLRWLVLGCQFQIAAAALADLMGEELELLDHGGSKRCFADTAWPEKTDIVARGLSAY